MNVGFEALADHADGVADAVVRVDHEFVREDMKDLAVLGEGNVSRGVNGAANVFALDVARPMAEGHATAAVHTADVSAGNADQSGLDWDTGDSFRLLDSAANGADGGIEIYDKAFAKTFRFRSAQSEKFHLLFVYLRDEH